jgi:hypothetical protein
MLSGDASFDLLSTHAGVALACMKTAAPGDNLQDYSDLADRHLTTARGLLPPAAADATAAFLLLALVRPTLRAIATKGTPLAPWRRQWILWRASKNLAKWI